MYSQQLFQNFIYIGYYNNTFVRCEKDNEKRIQEYERKKGEERSDCLMD